MILTLISEWWWLEVTRKGSQRNIMHDAVVLIRFDDIATNVKHAINMYKQVRSHQENMETLTKAYIALKFFKFQ